MAPAKSTALLVTGRPNGRTKKYHPDNLQRGLRALRATGVYLSAQRAMGISKTTWKYWIEKSRKGQPGDGFDIPCPEIGEGITRRWHEVVQDTLDDALDAVELKMTSAALGERLQILTNRDGIVYEYDDFLLEIGYTGRAAYKRDKNGDPIPVKIPMFDLDAAKDLLRAKRPHVWGHRKEVNVTGAVGVLVVGAKKNPKELEKAYGDHQEIIDVPFENVDKVEDDGGGDDPA